MNQSPVIIVGVTGRAGAGKSTFARMLVERAGAEYLEADKVAWELYAVPEIYAKLKDNFDSSIFKSDGNVDRHKLGNVVFKNPEALNKLNSIIHPFLVEELENRIVATLKKIIIIDAALLLDWSLADRCTFLIGVIASDAVCIHRMEEKEISSERARAILINQRPVEDFSSRCDIIIENNGSIEELQKKAENIWINKIAPLVK